MGNLYSETDVQEIRSEWLGTKEYNELLENIIIEGNLDGDDFQVTVKGIEGVNLKDKYDPKEHKLTLILTLPDLKPNLVSEDKKISDLTVSEFRKVVRSEIPRYSNLDVHRYKHDIERWTGEREDLALKLSETNLVLPELSKDCLMLHFLVSPKHTYYVKNGAAYVRSKADDIETIVKWDDFEGALKFRQALANDVETISFFKNKASKFVVDNLSKIVDVSKG